MLYPLSYEGSVVMFSQFTGRVTPVLTGPPRDAEPVPRQNDPLPLEADRSGVL